MNLTSDLQRAVQSIPDGCAVGIGGGPMSRKPMALVRELIRQGRRDLTVVTYVGGFDVDILLARGAVSAVRASYVGFDYLGRAPHFGASPDVALPIETVGSIVQGLRATAAGLDFLPFRGVLGTEVMDARPDLRTVVSPYDGTEYVAWPAVPVDVALIHVSRADASGNALLTGGTGIDRLLCDAAGRVIVSAERIVPELPTGTADATIVATRVSHVVEAQFGAHPTSCVPDYRVDLPHYLDYLASARAGTASEFVDELLVDPPAYRQRHVDAAALCLEVPA